LRVFGGYLNLKERGMSRFILSSKNPQFISEGLAQVENGDKPFRNRNFMQPMGRLRGVNFFLWVGDFLGFVLNVFPKMFSSGSQNEFPMCFLRCCQ
jgi:hypothetical protein